MTHDHLLDDIIATRPKARDARLGDGPGWLEEKYDGHRLMIVKDQRGVRAFERKVHIDRWPQLSQATCHAAFAENLPAMTVIEGELHSPNHRATSVPTLLRERPDDLTFSPFALPMLRGEDLRDAPLEEVRREIAALTNSPPTGRFIDTALTDADIHEFKRFARACGLEGFVFKRAHWSGWSKIKPLRSVDCIVYEELRGVGKFYGKLGALMIALRNERGALMPIGKVGGGFSDADREQPRGSWKGAVIEVEYQSVQANGRLQFPQFIRRRDDKPDAECTLDQLQE